MRQFESNNLDSFVCRPILPKLPQSHSSFIIVTVWCPFACSCGQLNGKHEAAGFSVRSKCAAPATVTSVARLSCRAANRFHGHCARAMIRNCSHGKANRSDACRMHPPCQPGYRPTQVEARAGSFAARRQHAPHHLHSRFLPSVRFSPRGSRLKDR